PPLVAAITGTREIGFAVIATTLTLASVFVPISFLPGDIGRLFREFGFTLAAAVLFSALIALTLTPMLASRLPADVHRGRFAHAIDVFFRRFARVYERVLRRIVVHPWARSEERRVGKEGSSRWSKEYVKKDSRQRLTTVRRRRNVA